MTTATPSPFERWKHASFSFEGTTSRLGYLVGWPILLLNWFVALLIVLLAMKAIGLDLDLSTSGRAATGSKIVAWSSYGLIWTNSLALVARRLRDTRFHPAHSMWIMGGHFVSVFVSTVYGEDDVLLGPVGTLGAAAFCVPWITLFFIPGHRARAKTVDLKV